LQVVCLKDAKIAAEFSNIGSVASKRGFRAVGGTHFAAYSRPLLARSITGGKQRGTIHAQRDPRDDGCDVDSMGDQHARITPWTYL